MSFTILPFIVAFLAQHTHSIPLSNPTSLAPFTNITTALVLVGSNGCVPTNWRYPWWHIGDVWYTAIKDSVNWYAAERKCRSIEPGKTNLATIKSTEEHTTLSNALKWLGGSTYVWIGGIKVEDTSAFYWYTNNESIVKLESMHVRHWQSGQPNEASSKQMCVRMYPLNNGNWYDASCTQSNRAFCELRC